MTKQFDKTNALLALARKLVETGIITEQASIAMGAFSAALIPVHRSTVVHCRMAVDQAQINQWLSWGNGVSP